MSTRTNRSDDQLLLRTYLSVYGVSGLRDDAPRCCDDERDILASHRRALLEYTLPAVPAWQRVLDAVAAFARLVASLPTVASRAGRRAGPSPRGLGEAWPPPALPSHRRSQVLSSDEGARRNAA